MVKCGSRTRKGLRSYPVAEIYTAMSYDALSAAKPVEYMGAIIDERWGTCVSYLGQVLDNGKDYVFSVRTEEGNEDSYKMTSTEFMRLMTDKYKTKLMEIFE